MLLAWCLICITPLNFWFWNNAYKVLLITLITTSCLSPANNTNYLHWERCEALFLISNPGKDDSLLAALESRQVTGEAHLWKTCRAIPPGSVWSTASNRGIISSQSPAPPCCGPGARQVVCQHPWLLRTYECIHVRVHTRSKRSLSGKTSLQANFYKQ